MTIGIAAAGPGAGRAILASLAAVEGFATGAIGGFLSFAAFGPCGEVLRAGVQRGGAAGLLRAGAVSANALAATRAVLMSSGPDRPEPLAQFTAARDGTGLVTGHRFPNMPGSDGRPLGEAVLDALAAGQLPEVAVGGVLAANPMADAGLILLGRDGHIALGNTAYVASFPDAGLARKGREGAAAAVLHNAIRPTQSLAPLIVELILDAMATRAEPAGSALLRRGLPVEFGSPGAVLVDDADRAVAVRLPVPCRDGGPWSAGFGSSALIIRNGTVVGRAAAEPYLIVKEGCVATFDGQPELQLPFNPEA